jgi:uncharacterized protein
MSQHKITNIPTFFLNLSTSSSTAAAKFFTALGFEAVPEYTDAQTSALRFPAPNNTLALMLHEHSRMKTFIRPDTEVADPGKTTEALFSLTMATREEVDATLAKAIAAGGTADPFTIPNYGDDCGMYSRSFTDLDGHIWEVWASVKAGDGAAALNS